MRERPVAIMDTLLEQLIENGPDGMARVFTALFELATRTERDQHIGAGIGRHQETLARWSLERGGHVRTGLEDNIRLDKHTLAPSNAALVACAAALCAEYDRHPATTAEARALLKLPALTEAA